jgi:hypothetical protein
MNTITFVTLPAALIGDVIQVQIGNITDRGRYHGQVQGCKVLAVRTTFNDSYAYLVEIVGDESYLCDVYTQRNGSYITTNARVIDTDRWTREACIKSLGYKSEHLAEPVTTVDVGAVIKVQIGNPGDSGRYNGKTKDCKVLAVRTTFNNGKAYLCEVVGDETYLCDAIPGGTVFVATNARVVNNQRWTRHSSANSLGYKLEEAVSH